MSANIPEANFDYIEEQYDFEGELVPGESVKKLN